ncbi:glycosyltransferase [Vagococcus fluvialis]|uniref:glycosyltransferase n=1 Tax=Vagococcus fluvialis TaxID=2738 RepID=UPI003D126043
MFSIIVPIYNVEEYLDRCLTSIVNQTKRPYEVVLVDDGSTDSSFEICDLFVKKYDYFKYIKKENGGLSDARNCGIKESSGEYILFLDSDDSIDEHTIEKFSSLIEYKKDIEVIVGNAYRIENGEKIFLDNFFKDNLVRSGVEYYYESLKNNKLPIASWLYIFRKDFILNNQLSFEKGIFHEDEDFTPKALLRANTILCTDIFFYNYYIRENSITTSTNKLEKRLLDLKNTYNRLKKNKLILNNRLLYQEVQNYWLNIFLEYLFMIKDTEINNIISKKDIFKMKALRKSKIKKYFYLLSPIIYFKFISAKRK